MSVTEIYSGIVLEQNAPAAGAIDWRNNFASQTIYQSFYLPDNYILGSTATEQRVPNLSGLQVMVNIDDGYASTATLSYTLDYYINGSGWSNLISGLQIGNHTDGQCWFNLIFPEAVEMDSTIASSLMRLGVTTTATYQDVVGEPVYTVTTDTYQVENQTIYAHLISEQPYPVTLNERAGFLLNHQGTVTFSAQQGVGSLYYTNESLLAPAGKLTESDGATLLVGASATMNFRVLALVADSGTSFLGDQYRSCVIIQDGSATDTGTEFWMSAPQPSPFAVVSRYFDLRPNASTLPFGTINLIENPSFEYDLSSNAPFGWLASDHLTTRSNLQVVSTWAYSGSHSLRSTSQFSGTSGAYSGAFTSNVSIASGDAYSASTVCNVFSLPNSTSGLQMVIAWYNSTGTQVGSSQSNVVTTLDVSTFSISNAIAPPNSVSANLYLTCTNGSGTLDFLIDAVQLTQSTTIQSYGDGDSPDWAWTGQRGRSASGPVISTISNEAQVVDGVLVDPATPNMAFNVYYSNDDANDSDNMSEADWEGKLWTRVANTFICQQRQQYVFPEPIIAEYIKLEFCNLNPQTYTPGSFAQPVTYKKFPTWVADFFVTQLELPSFTANLVAVNDDALTLAYDYYLDDLSQSPNDPSLDPPTTAQLTSFFQQSDAASYVDATTLRQINLIMQSYQVPTGSIVDPTTLLGLAAQSITNSAGASLTEEVPTATPATTNAVSTLNREPVVFEQSLPVMYFFLTCRHGYKEISATFDTGKAYYAGTNTIEFLRANYDVETDSPLYVEAGGDSFNAFRNDFVIDDDGDWYSA